MQDININNVIVDYKGNGIYSATVDGADVTDPGVHFESCFATEVVEHAYALAEKNVLNKGQHVELGVEISPCVQVIMGLEPSAAKARILRTLIDNQNKIVDTKYAGQGNSESPFIG